MTVAPRPLTNRSRRILYSLVSLYIESGLPVGSRRLSKADGIDLSPATIRNVLADLEDAGYLRQPHTSAGRTPTESGFRVFVDALVQLREVSADRQGAVLRRLRSLAPDADIVRETGRLLSALTGAASVLTAPRAHDEALAQLRFMRLRPGSLLAVLIHRSGRVQNRVVAWSSELTDAELERVHNYLAELASGRTLPAIRRLLAERQAKERGQYEAIRARAEALVEAASEVQEGVREVRIEGQERLFGLPEFDDADKLRRFLRAFEEKERLLSLLDDTMAAGGVQVVIGSEANLVELDDITIIASGYRAGGDAAGSLGVVGPSRIDYESVVPLVAFTAKAIEAALADRSSDA